MRLPVANLHRFTFPLLLAVSVGVGLYAGGLRSLADWQTPASYVIDSLEMLARLKIYGAQGSAMLVDQSIPTLGAPWIADWAAYPLPDAPVFIGLGWLSSQVGLIAASNVALLLAHVVAAAVFYFSSRTLGHRRLFAAACALCFGFSFYSFHRGLSHYSFALAYVVPAQLVSAWLIGSSHRLITHRPSQLFCILTAIATGMGNPYFGFAYGQLLVCALAYQAFTARHRLNLLLGIACLGLFITVLIGFNLDAIGALLVGQGDVLARNYAGTEVYGLRLVELLIPSYAHPWAPAAALAEHYARSTSLKGELFYPYLGLAGLTGALLILIDTGRRLLHRTLGARPAHAATGLWLILFFMVGGANSLLALGGLDLFRAGNRYSIYLLALALLALASWATRRGRHLSTGYALLITIPLTALCLWDQIPRSGSPADRLPFREKIALDQRCARALETNLPPGAAVFQLPAVPFLEQPPVHRMTDYELFRPWLYTQQLRFSYGLLAGERALLWQQWIAKQPPADFCAALERAGFSALYLHRDAYPDRGQALQKAFTTLGKTILFDEREHLAFALSPDAQPQRPNLDDPRLDHRWKPNQHLPLGITAYATKGWFDLEQTNNHTWRWAGRQATLSFWLPENQPKKTRLLFNTSALQMGKLTATINGTTVWENSGHNLLADVAAQLPLTLQPGANRLEFVFDGRLVRPSVSDPRNLGFRLENLRVETVPDDL